MKVQRFYRPEDISKDLGYRSGFWDLYAGTEQEEVDVDDIQDKCQVQRSGSPAGWHKHPQVVAVPLLLCIDPVPLTITVRAPDSGSRCNAPAVIRGTLNETGPCCSSCWMAQVSRMFCQHR